MATLAEEADPPTVAGSDSIQECSMARLVRLAYPSEPGPRDSFVYLPIGYDAEPRRRWPVLLFLHGDGERGDGGEDLAAQWLVTSRTGVAVHTIGSYRTRAIRRLERG